MDSLSMFFPKRKACADPWNARVVTVSDRWSRSPCRAWSTGQRDEEVFILECASYRRSSLWPIVRPSSGASEICHPKIRTYLGKVCRARFRRSWPFTFLCLAADMTNPGVRPASAWHLWSPIRPKQTRAFLPVCRNVRQRLFIAVDGVRVCL